MAKITKKLKAINDIVKPGKILSVDDAINALKKVPKAKFVESVDVSINLGIDSKKSDQAVRGATVLPKGTGKTVRVAVFAQGEKADQAKAAGADIVGFDDLAKKIEAGSFDFDVLIATPDAMPIVGKLGQVLGPRGLMPNPKVGTVTPDVAGAVKNAKAGQVRYRADKAGIVHCRIGTIEFSLADLKENLESLVAALKKAKPSSSKGVFLKKITLSTTMGPGIVIDQSSLNVL
jgi:large subunit ribosomal protein L1